MRLEISAFSELMPLLLPTRAGGYVIVVLYVIAIALFLRSHLPEWQSIATGSKLVGWLVLLAFGALLSGVVLVYTSEPGIIRSTLQSHILRVPGTPLLGAVAIMLVGSWLGMWPAVFVGLASGLVQSLFVTGRGIQIAEVTLVAALATYLLRQRFGGITYAILRHPMVVGLFAGVSSILLTYPAVLASIDRLGSMSLLATSANAWTLTQAIILPTLLQWFLAGTTLWLAAFAIDALRPPSTPRAVPAYARSLTQRFLFYLVPALLVVMALLLFVVTRIAIRSATDLVLQQMAHDARVASEMVPDVTVISSNVLDRFADERRAASLGLETTTNLSSDLESQLRSSNHFRQLVLVNKEGTVLQASPSIDEEQFPLSEVEALAAQAVARLGQPRTVRAWLADQRIPVHTHIEPLLDEHGQPIGALMGRVDLSVLLQPSVSSLQGTVGAGDGFIVDEEWTIIAHRRQDRLMQPWAPLKNQGETILDHRLPEGDMGYAYDAVSPSGSRQLIYYFVGLEHPWTVVIMVPFETVLRLATEVAVPLAGILLFMTVLLAAGLAFLTRRLTRPMASLAQSAVGISRGDFNTPIAVNGEDEVGQLGNAFEQMRESLQARLSELQLVLGVSRNVSSSLDLNSGLPPILDGALQVTGADGVRVVIAQDDDRNTNAFSRGSLAADMAPLDIPVARLVLREPHVRIENTARARLVLESFPSMGQVRAFAAFPIRSSLRFLGVLWIAYRRPHSFTDAEINFLSTLASQASVFVENVQLFDETERDRRRLAGILTSTQDSIVVTDIEGNIAMLNPAAENALNLSASVAKGQPAMTTFTDTGLTSLLSQHDANQASEIHLDDGRILYGRSSSILGEHDQELGRVAVLRDITDLKELDEMKTDFVSTVSHDLREPLMNMRGHVTMLPMVGEMNSKQSEYVEKIIADIDKMNELVSNLLDLAEIESGDDSELEMVDLEDTVDQVVEKYRSRAAGKGLEVDRIKAVPLPLVPGYPTLLRQAISNLVDNAIQYTSAGQVSVKTHVEGNEAIIQVSDTGTGVSQADQVRLFEKFFRVKKRDVLGGHGSGLGLAIVKSIIERRHGGRVWVKSQLGAGSTFTIALPIQSRTTGTNI